MCSMAMIFFAINIIHIAGKFGDFGDLAYEGSWREKIYNFGDFVTRARVHLRSRQLVGLKFGAS